MTEEVLDIVEEDPDILVPVALVAGGVGIAIGLFAGYTIARKHLTAKYEEIIREEIAESKEFYRRYYKVDEFESPGEARNKLIGPAADALDEYRDGLPADLNIERVTTEIRETNVFTSHLTEDEWDQEAEEALREARESSDIPYIIHHDEYMEGAHDYPQISLTYFKGDDVLIDNKDDVIPSHEIDRTVGEENLTRFGHGSKDNRIVYIRNDRLSMDFEVIVDDNEYAKKILGLQHSSDKPGVRRFRSADE